MTGNAGGGVEERTFIISVGSSRKATVWRHESYTVPDFFDRLKTPVRGAETQASYLHMKKGQQTVNSLMQGGQNSIGILAMMTRQVRQMTHMKCALDAGKTIQSVQDALANVDEILDQYSGASDEDKLLSYKEEICERVSYNDDAAAGNFDFNYGNPWQLLWVFDNDVETKVVCEGYSKAFKYLCDQSSFDSNITCILVTGTMAGGTGAGGHMWNIVKLGNGLNYLADVTNCDDGSIGSPDKLFLVRTEDLDTNGEIETGYTFHFDGSSVAYSYDENTLNYYNQNEISLGELQHVHDLIKTEAKDATCTEAGNIEYWTCSECEKLFSDEEGTTEITAADTVVPAKGHSLEKTEAKEATCTEAGCSVMIREQQRSRQRIQ